MGGDWNETSWGDLVELKYGKSLKDYKDAIGDVPVFGTNGPVGWCDKPLCDFPSVIVGRKGAYRGIHYSDNPFYVIDTAFYVAPKTDINLKWAYYSLLTQDINGMDSGSAIPSTSREDFYALQAKVPPRKIQDSIVEHLDALNDKIELNRQMNATLEAMAQALFKSWFVDFDPVIDNALAAGNPLPEELQARADARAALGDKRKPLPEAIQKQFPSRFVFTEEMGWVPEGWEAKSIGKLLELAYGKSLPAAKRKKGAVPVFGSGGISGYHDESLVDGPGIIVGRKGTVGSLFWVEENFFPIDTVFYVVNKTTVPLFWLYQALSLINIEAMAADSAVPGVNRNAVYARHLIVPQRGALGEYCVQIDSYNAKRKELSAQNEVLLQLRDTLLPKLLSGELRIPEAEKLAAEA